MLTQELIARLHDVVRTINETSTNAGVEQLFDLICDITADDITDDCGPRTVLRAAETIEPGDVIVGLWDYGPHTVKAVLGGSLVFLTPEPFPGWKRAALNPKSMCAVVVEREGKHFRSAMAEHTAQGIAELERRWAQ